MNEDKIVTIGYDKHLWEVGFFGEKKNGFNAYGFRQDGLIIRKTSKYEAEVFESFLIKAAAKEVKHLPEGIFLRYKLDENIIEELKSKFRANADRTRTEILEEVAKKYILTKEVTDSIMWYSQLDIAIEDIKAGREEPMPKCRSRLCTNWTCDEYEKP